MKKTKRPFVIYTMACASIFTAIIPLLLAIVGILGIVSDNPKIDIFVKCFSVALLFGGIAGTVLYSWLAWGLYTLKPLAYWYAENIVRYPLSNLGFWLASRFGKKLDDPQVRELFYPHKKDSPSPERAVRSGEGDRG